MVERTVVHRTIRVFGTVQGVFYRQSTKRQALQLRLTGFARNEPDGSVLIEVEGDLSSIERLIAWCRVGPPAAEVTRIESTEGDVVGYEDFRTG